MEPNKKCKEGDYNCTFGEDERTTPFTESNLFHDVELTPLLELSDMVDLRKDYKMLCKEGEKEFTQDKETELPWERFYGLQLHSEPPMDSRLKKKFPKRKFPFTAKYIHVVIPQRRTCVKRKKKPTVKPRKLPKFTDLKPEFVRVSEQRQIKYKQKRQKRKGCKGDSSCPTGMVCYCEKPYKGLCTKNQGFCVYKYNLADGTTGYSYESSRALSKKKQYIKGQPCNSDSQCKEVDLKRCGNSKVVFDGSVYTLAPLGTDKQSVCLDTKDSIKEIRNIRKTKTNLEKHSECITKKNCKKGLRCRKIQSNEGGVNVDRRVCKE